MYFEIFTITWPLEAVELAYVASWLMVRSSFCRLALLFLLSCDHK